MKNKKLLSEEEKLEVRLGYSHTKRFEILMKLIRINKMLKGAKIIYPEKK